MADKDIVETIQTEHQRFRELFVRLEQVDPGQRGELFAELCTRLARHETAEELIVYPRLKNLGTDGEQVADARISEEEEGEKLLAEMEQIDPTSQEFLQKLGRLRADVLRHAEHEEKEVFPRLREHIDASTRQKMAEQFEKAQQMGPTHPHPKAPNQPAAQALGAPIAALFDRARDRVKQVVGS